LSTTLTLATAPNIVKNCKLLYKQGCGCESLASDLLFRHGVIDAGYESIIKQADLAPNSNMVSTGDARLIPRHRDKEGRDDGLFESVHAGEQPQGEVREGIDWSNHLRHKQYYDDGYGKSAAKFFSEVKPQVLGIRDAAGHLEKGLLHVMVQPFVPIKAFEAPAVQMLIHHKWTAFARNTFVQELFLFVWRIGTWQLLAFLVAQYGTHDTVPDVESWRAVFGACLAAVSLLLAKYFDVLLPLSPRSRQSDHVGRRVSFVKWHAIQGWECDHKNDNARVSLLQYAVRCTSGLSNHSRLLLWFIIILPVYFCLALAVHLGPLVASALLLGATVDGVHDVFAKRSLFADAVMEAELRTSLGQDHNLREIQCLFVGSIAMLLALSGRAVAQELRQLHKATFREHFLADPWDTIDLLNLSLTASVVLMVLLRKDPVTISQLAVINTVSLWFRGIQMLSGFDATAKYISMFFAVTRDMSSFLGMLMIFIVGNGFALILLYPIGLGRGSPSDWAPLHADDVRLKVDTLSRAMYSSFDMMMGGFDAELLNDAVSPRLAWLLFFLYILTVNIVMLNLLIALMVRCAQPLLPTCSKCDILAGQQ
jgi:hypothetical protein